MISNDMYEKVLELEKMYGGARVMLGHIQHSSGKVRCEEVVTARVDVIRVVQHGDGTSSTAFYFSNLTFAHHKVRLLIFDEETDQGELVFVGGRRSIKVSVGLLPERNSVNPLSCL